MPSTRWLGEGQGTVQIMRACKPATLTHETLRPSEEPIRSSDDRYRSVVEDLTEVISRFREDGSLVFVSEAFCRVFGSTAGELLGRHWQAVAVPEDVPAIEERLRALTPAEPVAVIENRVNTAREGVRWMQFVNRGFFDASGRLVEVQSVGRDITERKMAEADLARSREALRALAAQTERAREEERVRISREIHDELGHTFADLRLDLEWLSRRLAEAGFAGRSTVQRRIRAMSASAAHAAGIVRRIATELRPAVLDEVGLPAAIEWKAREFEERTGIRCLFAAGEGLPPAGPERSTAVFRILEEILGNAAQHARCSSVRIRLASRGDALVLEVEDDGRGISREEISSQSSIGLLGIRERAAAHGGRAVVVGEPGRGTVWTVTFPSGPP